MNKRCETCLHFEPDHIEFDGERGFCLNKWSDEHGFFVEDTDSCEEFTSLSRTGGGCGMKERPIAFNTAMVKAILAGRKSHTRRTSRIPQAAFDTDYCLRRKKWAFPVTGGKTLYRQCPYGVAGDRLWVKEYWRMPAKFDEVALADIPVGASVGYLANDPSGKSFGKARPATVMPRWASRILLEVVSSRCEHLQAIDYAGAITEGVESVGSDGHFSLWRDYSGYCSRGFVSPVHSFISLWDAINGQKPEKCWAANPWVWDIEFRVLEVRS